MHLSILDYSGMKFLIISWKSTLMKFWTIFFSPKLRIYIYACLCLRHGHHRVYILSFFFPSPGLVFTSPGLVFTSPGLVFSIPGLIVIKRFRKYDNSYTRTNFITTSPRERSNPNLITNKFRNPAKHELFQMKGLFSDPFPRSPPQPTSPLDFTICSQIAQSSFHFVGQLVTRLSDLWFFSTAWFVL